MTAAWAARTRTGGLNIDPDDLRDSNFFADRVKIEAVGRSSDERITISTVGVESFSVHVERGTVRGISARQFSADAGEAATKVIQDFQAKVNELKKRYYE